MITYETLEDGSLSGNGRGAIPAGHRWHKEALQLVEDGKAVIVPYVEPAKPARQARDEALAALVHDFGDGRVMQTRPKDEANIRNAIELMGANSIPTMGWVMADDVKHPVTAAELQEALTAGQLAAMAVWDAYNPEA